MDLRCSQLSVFFVLAVLLALSVTEVQASRFEGEAGGLKGIGGMGGGFKGVGGMGGGCKGVGGMGGGFKGVGGMGGGFKGVGDAGGGFSEARSHYYDARYGGYSRRYGENNPRYGGTEEMNETSRYGTTYGRYNEPVDESGNMTRYGTTYGRYGEPVGQADDESLAARYQRVNQYSRLMNQIASSRSGMPSSTGMAYGAGSAMQRLRTLESHPPSSFNHIYVP
ncbi:MAG: hypothetical protein K2X27_16880 [Candidatus Obscuribacterales bacterium]|nr:hypothetical protein [Candidatus Obscuribacterales bacterium]